MNETREHFKDHNMTGSKHIVFQYNIYIMQHEHLQHTMPLSSFQEYAILQE